MQTKTLFPTFNSGSDPNMQPPNQLAGVIKELKTTQSHKMSIGLVTFDIDKSFDSYSVFDITFVAAKVINKIIKCMYNKAAVIIIGFK